MSSEQSQTSSTEIGKMNIRDMTQALTGGRPYAFVIMSFHKRGEIFRHISQVIAREFNLACIRADDLKTSGYDLLSKIHTLITKAELVIAEISDPRPNVFYELGYAIGVQRMPLLLIQRPRQPPADLKGLEVLEYETSLEGVDALERRLILYVKARLNCQLALLRDMLEAPASLPAYIVASPKYPGLNSRIVGQVYDSRTFGDQLGILGLITTFGAMWGEAKDLHLVSAQHGPPDLLKRPLNLYLIGANKVNGYTKPALCWGAIGEGPQWSFAPQPGFTPADADWPCGLYRTWHGRRDYLAGEKHKAVPGGAELWFSDFGIVVRRPHPLHPGRLVFVMAGAHSLGTGAACLAATRSELVEQVRARLPDGALERKTVAFWALVKGTASADGLLDASGVEIVEAGTYV